MPATRIALLGDKDLGKVTHRALAAAVAQLPPGVEAAWIGTDTSQARAPDAFDGIWMLPGTPYRDDDAALAAIGIAPLACSLIGEEREVTCVPGTRLAAICGTAPFTGFHWCNYGLADAFVERLADAGVVVSAHAPDAGVEGIELPDHPFFVATLFQPQIGALAGAPLHPLITAFVQEAARVRVDG